MSRLSLRRAAPAARVLSLVALAASLAACRGNGDRVAPSGGAAATATTATADGSVADTALLRRADDGRIAGREDARVWLIEVSDFQCPYCRQWHDSTYPQVRREYVDAGKIRMAYVHLPLPSHRHAWPAAEASMCAAVQDRFWPVHDGIFDAQREWTPMPDATPVFARIAERAGVDMAAWRRCMSEHQTRPLIAADAERAQRSGIESTPSFIVGNQLIAGAYPIEVFRQVLDSAIAAAGRPGGAR